MSSRQPNRFCHSLPLSLQMLDRRDLPSVAIPYYYAAPEAPRAFDEAGHGLVGNGSRINDKLLTLFNERQPQGALADYFQFDADGSVAVRVTGNYIPALETPLAALGFRTAGSSPELHFVEGYLPISQLPAAEKLAGCGLLGISAVPNSQTRVGLVTSEGDWVLESDRVRGDKVNGGFTGAGVRVGVVSDCFSLGQYKVNDVWTPGITVDIASGDLPADTVILNEGKQGIDEGRAMAQIIHDVAPGAAIRFGTAGAFESDMAQQIKDLANPAIGNCKVVVDDIGFYWEPMYQHGVIAQAIDYVASNYKTAYFSASGNEADRGYENTLPNFFNDATYGNALDFLPGAGIDIKQRITLGTEYGNNRTRIVLQWDDPWYTANGVDTDLNIYLYRADTGALVESSKDNALATQEPVEDLLYENDTGQTQFDLVIVKGAGPTPGRLRYIEWGKSIMTEYGQNGPAVVGHPGIASAAGVGAVPWFDQTNAEWFTSVGGCVTLFAPDGTKLNNLVVEPGPRIAAVDGVNTTFFYSDSKVDPDTNKNFFGTSAAAPHAAAVAALMLDKNFALTPDQIYQTLENTADGSVGEALTTGHGLINAYDAIVSTPYPTSNPVHDGFEKGLGPNWETHNTGAGRIGVTTDHGPAEGLQHVVLDSGCDGTASLNELILHVNLAGATNALLSFKQRQYIDPDNPMSASFSGSEDSDGVALSVDGLNWYRIVSLTGFNSVNNYQQFDYNLNTIASAAGITLSSNTRIKFQRYGDEGLPNEGMAFDDIAVASSTSVAGISYIDSNENGTFDGSDIGESNRVVFVDANNNGQLDYAGGTIVTSGQMPAPINDVRRTLYPLVVNGSGVVDDANVTINLTHTYDGDLDIALIHPNGTRVELSSDNGGASDNYTNTTFDDEAATLITAAAAPFTGRFRSEQLLSKFDGLAQTGTWYLEITDDAGGDTGTLLSWSLELAGDSKNFANNGIPDNSTIYSYLNFFGSPGVLSDVDVTVNINHTYDADLDLYLIGPNGKQVELSTDNGSSSDNYVNTRFDDEATTSITAGTAPFTGRFQPEGPLSDLDGISANGSWALKVTDDDPVATGTLVDWTLSLARTFTAPGSIAIPDNATMTSSVIVPDLGSAITDLDVTLSLEHSYDADLDIFLTSPGGQKITLTSDNGDTTDNFTNTRFDDEASVSVTAGMGPFAGRFRPETPLGLFDGDAIAGTWTLTVTDDYAVDTGNLLGWSMDFHHDLKFDSVNVPRTIDDFSSPVSSILFVSGATGLINDLNVQLDITHTYDADLEVYLTAPSGQKAYLIGHAGGKYDNFTNTKLDDEATTSIGNGSAPFTGTYRPQTSLSLFDGLDPNGSWLLTIIDTAASDNGTLNDWSITFTTGERFDITDANGRYEIPALPTGSITLREQLPPGLKHTEPASDSYTFTMPSLTALSNVNFGSTADVTAPTAKITAVSPDPRHDVVPSINIVFSEPVTGLDVGDLTFKQDGIGVSLAGATLNTSDNITWALGNLAGLTTAEGLYDLTLSGLGSSIVDGAKNAYTASVTESWTMDTTAPTVVSIVRNDVNPAAAGTVSWTVTFSEPVLLPLIPNFALFGSAANGALVTGVIGSGTTRTVTASTAGDGELGLRMANSNNVSDAAGNQVAPLPFDGESYTVDRPDIHIDLVQVNDGAVQRSRVDYLVVKFDQIVSFKHAPELAFGLSQTPSNTAVNFTAGVDNSSGRTVVTLQNFTGAATEFGSLADGYYRLFVQPLEVYSANGVLDGNNDGKSGDAYYSPTGPAAGAVFRLFGDANGDRNVTSTDFAAFRTVFGLSGPSIVDFQNDGQTNSIDFAEFRKRFGITLVP